VPAVPGQKGRPTYSHPYDGIADRRRRQRPESIFSNSLFVGLRFNATTIRNHPERFVSTTAQALARGLPLGRPMTSTERRVVAVISAHPTHTLTLHSRDASHPEMTALFRRLIKRLNRYLAHRKPLAPVPVIYVATVPRARGSDGHHVHAILWDYIHAPTLIGHCKDLGLGKPKLGKLPASSVGDLDYWQQVTYVLAQQEPAFGSDEDRRHENRPRSARRLLYPQKPTLQRHCPQLLSGLEAANDKAVPDETLLSRLPTFSRSS